MTTEMYGAPFGIQQAEQGINQNILSGLKAQQMLGEIGMQPAEQRLKGAHARLYESEALLKEQQVRDAEAMNAIEQEVMARRRLVAEKAAQGEIATVADIPAGGLVKERSQADPVEEFLSIAEGKIPESKLTPLREKVTLIKQHEAAAANSKANQMLHSLNAQEKISESLGSLAQGALAQPQMYPLIRAEAVRRGIPQQVFPETFNPDLMRTYIDASMKTKDKVDLERKKVLDEAHIKRWGAANAKDAMNAKLAGARYNLVNEKYQLLKKNAGEASPEVKALREERTLASEAKRKAADRKEFPLIPLSRNDREPNTNYTAGDGSKVQWVEKLDGTFGALELSPPPGSKKAAALSASMPKAATDLSADDSED